MLQQEFIHWQNDFFCSVFHLTTAVILVTFLTIPDCWADDVFEELPSWLWDHAWAAYVTYTATALMGGWCCCSLICSRLHFLPLNSPCHCILPSYLSSCSTIPFLQQQSWSKKICEYFALSANIFVVLIALFSRSLMNRLSCTGPSPRPTGLHWQSPCSGETIHLFLSFVSHHKTNYPALQGNLLLANDTC